MSKRTNILEKSLIGVVKGYQRIISPLKPRTCRFYPTCSEYFVQAIMYKGALRGIGLALLRVIRCHPFNPGGYDPVKR